MKLVVRTVPLLFITLAAACMTVEEPVEGETSTSQSELSCQPGTEICDYGCNTVGLPSTNDCIVRCNSKGTGWTLVEDCGWAQNWPYSSSCYPSQPHPHCEWN